MPVTEKTVGRDDVFVAEFCICSQPDFRPATAMYAKPAASPVYDKKRAQDGLRALV